MRDGCIALPAFVSNAELVADPRDPQWLLHDTIDALRRDVIARLNAAREQVLEDFLCSGAFLWDLSVIEGRPTAYWTNQLERPEGVRLRVEQEWRVR